LDSVTLPPEILNTRLVLFPLNVKFDALGPLMLIFLAINSSPLVSVMVPVTAKPMVSSCAASVIAWRSEPGRYRPGW